MHQNGWTSLMWGAREGRLPMIEYLMEKGADMEAKYAVSGFILMM